MKKRKYNERQLLQLILYSISAIILLSVIVFVLVKTGVSVDLNNKSKNADTVIVDNTDFSNDKPETHISVIEKNVYASYDIECINDNEPSVPEKPISKDSVFKTITFAAAGDIIVHTNVYKYAAQLAQGSSYEYDFKPMMANIKDIISSADIAFVNQESPCAGKDRGYSGYPMFNTPDEIAEAVVDCGFDVVNIANNHMLDKGVSGHIRNVEFWNSKDVTLIGGFLNKEDYENIRIIEKNGTKIAFLAYTYSTNGISLPSSAEIVIPYENYDEIDRQTKLARKMADIVIVSMHWGHEDWFSPSDNQKSLADMMTENGVDVIIGTHPHVLQPVEWKTSDDGHKTLVIYSLGNLISTMMYSRNMLGSICTFTILETNGEYSITDVQMIPTMTYYKSGFASPTVYLYRDFDDDMLSKHGAHKYDPKMSRSYLDGIIKKTIKKEFINDPHYDEVYGIQR